MASAPGASSYHVAASRFGNVRRGNPDGRWPATCTPVASPPSRPIAATPQQVQEQHRALERIDHVFRKAVCPAITGPCERDSCNGELQTERVRNCRWSCRRLTCHPDLPKMLRPGARKGVPVAMGRAEHGGSAQAPVMRVRISRLDLDQDPPPAGRYPDLR